MKSTKLYKELTEIEKAVFWGALNDEEFVYVVKNINYVVVTDGKLDRWGSDLNQFVELLGQGKIQEAYTFYHWSSLAAREDKPI